MPTIHPTPGRRGGGEGIYADIVRSVTASMDEYEVVLKAMPWRRGLSMVEQGSAFAIFPPYYQPDSRPWMWPYSQPLLDEELVVMCGAGVAVNTRRRSSRPTTGCALA